MVKIIPESPEQSSTDHSNDNASQSSHLCAISSAGAISSAETHVQTEMALEALEEYCTPHSETMASIDNKEEEEKESHVQVLSMKKIDLTLLDIMNHIASSFATNFLRQLEIQKLGLQMNSIKNQCDILNTESALTWKESISYIVKKYPFHEMNDVASMGFFNLILTKCIASLNGLSAQDLKLAEKNAIRWISTFIDAISKRKDKIKKLMQIEDSSTKRFDDSHFIQMFSVHDDSNKLTDEV